MNEFYIGYATSVPAALRRFLLCVVLALSGMAVVAALLLAFHQQPFANSRFEYLQYRQYAGAIAQIPYPTLVNPEGHFLLVAPGKHPADLNGLDSQLVRLNASLIQRGSDRMLEILPGSVYRTGTALDAIPIQSLGQVSMDGEIVDSKCYLGVMNPGNGKVHRDCAVRCISGGIPPALAVRDAAGTTQIVLLTGTGRKQLLPMVAEAVRARGQLVRRGDALVLNMGQGGVQRLEKLE